MFKKMLIENVRRLKAKVSLRALIKPWDFGYANIYHFSVFVNQLDLIFPEIVMLCKDLFHSHKLVIQFPHAFISTIKTRQFFYFYFFLIDNLLQIFNLFLLCSYQIDHFLFLSFHKFPFNFQFFII